MILNLTQHRASAEQKQAGVIEPEHKERVKTLLTFEEPPSSGEMFEQALELARIAKEAGADAAMIGGMPAFMGALERELVGVGVAPLYSFSRRESVEEEVEGEVVKTSRFRHVGWVTPEVVIPNPGPYGPFAGFAQTFQAEQKEGGEWQLLLR